MYDFLNFRNIRFLGGRGSIYATVTTKTKKEVS